MATQSDLQGRPAGAKAGWGELFRDGRGVYTVVLNLGIALHALDIFIVTTIMPTVVDDIGGLAFYTWTSMLYMVGSITGAACGGHMRLRFGRRRGYVYGALLFLAGTLSCALAPTMPVLLGARVIMGTGGGMVISQSMALISELYEPRVRTRILALVTSTWSVAAVVGPAIGGIFAEIDWWRGAFWSNVPFIALFVTMAWRAIPEAVTAAGRRLPWRRLLLLTAGVMCVAVTGEIHNRPLTIGMVALAAAAAWLTLRIDGASAHRLFPSHVLSAFAPVGVAYWVFFLISMTHSALLVFAPLFLQVLHGVSPLYTGYLSLVFSIGWTFGSIVSSGLSGRRERFAPFVGMVLAASSIAVVAATMAGGWLVVITVAIAITGIGIGMTNVLMTAFGMAAARAGEESVTASSMPTIRSLGVAFGAAIAGLIANAVGLSAGTEPATVARVSVWVIGLTVVPPTLAALFALRSTRWAGAAKPAPAH
jgi:MFS family permease